MSALNQYMTSLYVRARCRDEGAGMVEYALLVALIGVLLVVALGALRGGIIETFNDAISVLGGTEAPVE